MKFQRNDKKYIYISHRDEAKTIEGNFLSASKYPCYEKLLVDETHTIQRTCFAGRGWGEVKGRERERGKTWLIMNNDSTSCQNYKLLKPR